MWPDVPVEDDVPEKAMESRSGPLLALDICKGIPNAVVAQPHVLSHPPRGLVCPRAAKVGARLYGLATAHSEVARRCPCNVVNALVTRHLVASTEVHFSVLADAGAVHDELKAALSSEIEPLDFDEWNERWPAGKREMLEESLAIPGRFRQRGQVKAFSKRETARVLKKVRAIQMYANIAAQAESGYRVTRLQRAMKRCFRSLSVAAAGGSSITFASGMSAEDISAWARRAAHGALFFIEQDGKNWDATMNAALQAFKFDAFDSFDPGLGWLLRQGLDVKGSSAGGIRYRAYATTKSGHNDTTVGNSYINALICLSVMRVLGWVGHIIVAGDDSLVAVHHAPPSETGSRASDFARVARRFGIVPETGSFAQIQHCTFISGRFVGPDALFCPKIGRLTTRLNWTCSLVGKPDVHKRGIRLGLGATGRLPLIATLLDPFGTLGEGAARASSMPYHTQAHEGVDEALLEDSYGLEPGSFGFIAAWFRAQAQGMPTDPAAAWGKVVEPCWDLESMIEQDFAEMKDRVGVLDYDTPDGAGSLVR